MNAKYTTAEIPISYDMADWPASDLAWLVLESAVSMSVSFALPVRMMLVPVPAVFSTTPLLMNAPAFTAVSVVIATSESLY
jgi:hypothetical protein